VARGGFIAATGPNTSLIKTTSRHSLTRAVKNRLTLKGKEEGTESPQILSKPP
jgi:hypothetical protein